MNIINKKNFLTHLKRLGLKSTDNVLVYSNLSSFGSLDKNLPKRILDYLLSFFTIKGTLVMPSYTFDHPKDFIFNINKLQKNYSTGSLVKEFFKKKMLLEVLNLFTATLGLEKNPIF